MKRIIIMSVFLIFTKLLVGQNYSITGNVKDWENKPLDYFNVIVLKSDSSFVKGGTFIGGTFRIPNVQASNCILKISYMGINAFQRVSNVNDTIVDIGTVQIGSATLKEVQIVAKRPEFKIENGAFTFHTENSSASKIGTALDVLQQTPMLVVDNSDNVTVSGRGAPAIYIDGRRITGTQELKNIKSSSIKRVEVITNPTAKYDAEGSAVVNIILQNGRNNKKEWFNLSVLSETSVGRKIRNSEEIQSSLQMGKVNLYGSYAISSRKYVTNQEDNRFFSLSTDMVNTFYKTQSNQNSLNNTYRVGLEYAIFKKHKLGIQCNGWISDSKDSIIGSNLYKIKGQTGTIKNQTYRTGKNPFVNVNFNYKFSIDSLGQYIQILFDYAKHTNHTKSHIGEIEETINTKQQQSSDANSKIYSGKIDYYLPLPAISSVIETGVKASQVDQANNNDFYRQENGIWVDVPYYSNKFNYNEHLWAAYVSMQKQWNKFTFKTGLRYENQQSKALNEGNILFDKNYANFFPSGSIEFQINKNSQIMGSYAKRISRPSYQSLNPTIFYYDKYAYVQGNPNLLASISHNFSLSAVIFKNLSIDLAYIRVIHPVNPMFVQDAQNEDITIIKQQNYDKMEYYNTNLVHTYYNKARTLSIVNNVSYNIPNMKIIDHGKLRTINKGSFYYRNNTSYTLKSKTEFSLTFVYLAAGEVAMSKAEPEMSLSFGIAQKFLKDKLNVSLLANDVFRTWIWKDSFSIGNMYRTNMWDGDTRYVKLRISWDFGILKKLKQQSGNTEERNRL